MFYTSLWKPDFFYFENFYVRAINKSVYFSYSRLPVAEEYRSRKCLEWL